MEELFRVWAGYVALGLEIVAVVLIAIGAIDAIVRLIRPPYQNPRRPLADKKEAWVRLGVWLLLGLEF